MKRRILQLCILVFSVISVSAATLDEAKSALQRLTDEGQFVNRLDPSNVHNITPIGLRHTMGNTTVTLAVSKVRNMKEYCSIDVYARVFLPSRDVNSPEDSIPLFFGAEGIKLSKDGDIVGDAKLALLQDIRIPVLDNNATLVLKGGMNGRGGDGGFDIRISLLSRHTEFRTCR